MGWVNESETGAALEEIRQSMSRKIPILTIGVDAMLDLEFTLRPRRRPSEIRLPSDVGEAQADGAVKLTVASDNVVYRLFLSA